jgi:hypothetical protein
MAPQKLQAGSDMPKITLPKVGGGEVSTEAGDRWKMVVVYRGKHCPICKTYLKTLDGLLDDFNKIDTDVIAISGDPQDKAESEVKEENWRFDTGYDPGARPDARPRPLHLRAPFARGNRSPVPRARPVRDQPRRQGPHRRRVQRPLRPS